MAIPKGSELQGESCEGHSSPDRSTPLPPVILEDSFGASARSKADFEKT